MMAGQDSARTCFYILEGNPADLNAFGQGVLHDVCMLRLWMSRHCCMWNILWCISGSSATLSRDW
jgi:hypothetical protein